LEETTARRDMEAIGDIFRLDRSMLLQVAEVISKVVALHTIIMYGDTDE